MKFGIWGCEHGHISIFIEEMIDLGHECVGIYEPRNKVLTTSLADKYKIAILSDHERLLQPDVDVIGSSAINNEKINIIEQCEQAGKHIMIDKPVVTNRQSYERLQSVIQRGKIQVGMLLTERFHPAVHTLKLLIDRGELGRLTSIGIRKPHRLSSSKRPEWFFSREKSGGILIDLLIHDFDLLYWLTGDEIESTNGYMGKHILPEYSDFYDVVNVQVKMRDGLVAQLYADWHTPDRSWTWGDGRIFITGTLGFAELRLSGDPMVDNEALMLKTTHMEETVRVPLEKPSCSIMEDFLIRISGKPSIVTHNDIISASLASIDADERILVVQSEEKG